MSILSVRLPRELDRALPRRDRSAWVIDAIRQRLRRERVRAIAQSAAEQSAAEREALADWEPATAPLAPPRAARPSRRRSKR